MLAGTNFEDDRGNVTATLEYTQQDGLTYADRKDLPYATFQPSDALSHTIGSSRVVTARRSASVGCTGSFV